MLLTWLCVASDISQLLTWLCVASSGRSNLRGSMCCTFLVQPCTSDFYRFFSQIMMSTSKRSAMDMGHHVTVTCALVFLTRRLWEGDSDVSCLHHALCLHVLLLKGVYTCVPVWTLNHPDEVLTHVEYIYNIHICIYGYMYIYIHICKYIHIYVYINI